MNDTPFDIQVDGNIIRVGDRDGRGGLYNMLVPDAYDRLRALIPAIGLNPDAAHLYRARDAWIERDPLGVLHLHLYTRIGGNNRDDYADQITALRGHPFYERDADDTFDSTYAGFWFTLPSDLYETLAPYAVEPVNTDEVWAELLEAVKKMDPK